jgi:hypothetical protein
MWLCHFPEVPAPLVDVAYWGKTGRHLLAMSSSQFDPTATSGTSHIALAKLVSSPYQCARLNRYDAVF